MRKVLCVELDETFESINECTRQLTERFKIKFHHSSISRVCNGKQNKCKGYTFKYVD